MLRPVWGRSGMAWTRLGAFWNGLDPFGGVLEFLDLLDKGKRSSSCKCCETSNHCRGVFLCKFSQQSEIDASVSKRYTKIASSFGQPELLSSSNSCPNHDFRPVSPCSKDLDLLNTTREGYSGQDFELLNTPSQWPSAKSYDQNSRSFGHRPIHAVCFSLLAPCKIVFFISNTVRNLCPFVITKHRISEE